MKTQLSQINIILTSFLKLIKIQFNPKSYFLKKISVYTILDLHDV